MKKESTFHHIVVKKNNLIVLAFNLISTAIVAFVILQVFNPLQFLQSLPFPILSLEFFIYFVFPIFLLLSNLYAIFWLVKKKENSTKKQLVLSVIVAHIPIWILLFFIGYIFASTPLFPLLSLLIIIITFFFLRRISFRWAVMITAITAILIVFAIITGFEEDFCLKKAATISNSDKMMKLPKEDAGPIETYPDEDVSRSFYAHVACHKHFNFWQALKESYL